MFLDAFYANPLAFIGLVFACMAAAASGIFFSGFFPGLRHLFTQSEHEEHQQHFRVRAVRGVLLLVHIFILWEIIRMVASWFTGGDSGPALGLISTYVILMIILSIAFGLTNAMKNRH